MIKKLPLFVGRQPSSDLINSGLSEFRWEELCDKEEIGRGRIGAVFTAKSRGEVVVIKKLFRQNACEKRLFLKEDKILKDPAIPLPHSPSKRVLRKSISHNISISILDFLV